MIHLQNRQTIYAAISLAIVSTIDFLAPLGIAVGVLYLVCLFFVIQQNKKIIITLAIITALLVITKFLAFHDPNTTPYALYNRIITIFAILVFAILAIKHRNLTVKINEQRAKYTNEIEQMLFKTSHELRRPVANYLGLMQLLDTNKTMTNKELKQVTSHFMTSVIEIDRFTKEITQFIHDIKTSVEDKNCA